MPRSSSIVFVIGPSIGFHSPLANPLKSGNFFFLRKIAPQPALMRIVIASDKRRTAAHVRNFDVRAVKRSVREIPNIKNKEKDGALPRLFLPK
jgi:hypothetical protein